MSSHHNPHDERGISGARTGRRLSINTPRRFVGDIDTHQKKHVTSSAGRRINQHAAEDDRPHADGRYDPQAQVLAHGLPEVVTSELDRMSERNRLAYILLKEERLSVKEAAAVLGTTTDVVKQRAHRAYEELRATMRMAGWKEHSDEPSRDAVPIEA